MGGRGSGNRYRWETAQTTEDYYALDVGSVRRWLRPGTGGSSRWMRGGREVGSVGWTVLPDTLVLYYRAAGEDHQQHIGLDWTRCHYGGRRAWFRCPQCSRRCGVLFGGPTFLCRVCGNLAYPSSREEPHYRHLRRARKIRARLGDAGGGWRSMAPAKPRGMHWRTYWQLYAAAEVAEAEMWAALAGWLGALNSKKER